MPKNSAPSEETTLPPDVHELSLVTTLRGEDAVRLGEALEAPPAPTEYAIRAVRRYLERTGKREAAE